MSPVGPFHTGALWAARKTARLHGPVLYEPDEATTIAAEHPSCAAPGALHSSVYVLCSALHTSANPRVHPSAPASTPPDKKT